MDLSGYSLRALAEDEAFALYRGGRPASRSVLVLAPTSGWTAANGGDRLQREYALAGELEEAWAVQPVELTTYQGRTVLLLEDTGGEPLEASLGGPLEISDFLEVAIRVAGALRQMHKRGLIHNDLKPSHVVIGSDRSVRLTGFGRATGLAHGKHDTGATIGSSSLAYMAPEYSGRMNRRVDARSDLYAFGVVLYRMITGHLPFTASDPLELIHCHVARRPPPPSESNLQVPAVLDGLILKLLAKSPDERYQSASGIEHDLRFAHDTWTLHGRIYSFPLGMRDRLARSGRPPTLYGRAPELANLVSAFDRVAARGSAELVLVSGSAGAGKSTLVEEFLRVASTSLGVAAVAKADQYMRGAPHATLALVVQSLVHQLLSKDDAELDRRRIALLGALGPNGQLMINLAPELAHIVGPQPPAQELSPTEEKSRFQGVLRRFLGVFSEPARPLTLFLDDLQWIDQGTLEVLERMVADPDVRGLLIVGAYRENEIDSAHPIAQTLLAITALECPVVRIALGPLETPALQQLISATLSSSADQCFPLTEVVVEKTEGNPFFVVQLLARLVEEDALTFTSDATGWQWNLDRIRVTAISENLAELMAGKLNRLADEAGKAVRKLACLGDKTHAAKLAKVLDATEAATHGMLSEAIREGLVIERDGAYSFAHDRIQEAAYALVPVLDRPAEHLSIAKALWSLARPQQLDDHVFEIINHMDRGFGLLETLEEREHVCELYLLAGKRARASTAYAPALSYLQKASSLLREDRWTGKYSLAFDTEFHLAECEYLTGGHAAAEARLSNLATRATSLADRAAATRILIALYTTVGDPHRAVQAGLACVAHVGIVWTPQTAEERLRAELDEMNQLRGEREIAELIELPRMSDPNWLAAMDVLASLILPALITNNSLEEFILLRMANLSLSYGNCDASCYAYAQLNVVLGLRFGDYQAGFQFGQLGCDLVDKCGMDRWKARVYTCFSAFVLPWVKHLPTCLPLARRAAEIAGAVGDLVFEASTYQHVAGVVLMSGARLTDVQQETERYRALSEKMEFTVAIGGAISQLMLIRELRGFADDEVRHIADVERTAFQRRLQDDGAASALPLAWYWIHQMQAGFHAQDYSRAVEAAGHASGLLQATRSLMNVAEFHFYGALIQAAACDHASPVERPAHIEKLHAHHREIQVWAANCPENFSNREALVAAEIARLENRHVDAQRCYEHAVRLSRQYGFLHVEAIGSELAAALYRSEGLTTAANSFLRDARSRYLQWGADGKVRQLDRKYPWLANEAAAAPEQVGRTVIGEADLFAVIGVIQSLSSEIARDRLIERLMTTVVEHAGAVRGLLLFRRSGEIRLVTEAVTGPHGIVVSSSEQLDISGKLPQSVLNQVLHTQTAVILGDALTAESYSADPYVRACKPRSVMCLPLTKSGQLVGALYLENGISPDLFTRQRLIMIQFLTSLAAVSIENAELFSDVQNTREQARRAADELRRSLDMIPALVWIAAPDGTVVSVNKQWTDFTGISQESATAGAWGAAFHPDDIGKVAAKWNELVGSRVAGEVEARMIRASGGARSFLIRATPMYDDDGNVVKWYGSNTDIDDMKRAEEMQAALSRAGRLTALGELTVSVAHEVNQPLMAIVTNAAACLQWLKEDRLNVPEARQAAERVIRDGHRAGDVIASIRGLARKSSPNLVKLHLNELIREVLALVSGELHRRGTVVEIDLPSGGPLVLGDRIQLQQVVLNLVMNAIEAMDQAHAQPRLMRIALSAEKDGWITVSICDSGPGLAPSTQEQIFDTFFTTKPDGIGMGLSICRSILQAHGGRLWASPNTPAGTVFRFTVPTSTQEPAVVPGI